MSAYKKQVGGSHYKDMKIQASQFINENRLPFAEGSAIKYICRHALKGKEQDIDKAIEFSQKCTKNVVQKPGVALISKNI